MWKSCQEKTGLSDTKCCGERVVSVYVSWYVCETYVDRFAANFPFWKRFNSFATSPCAQEAYRCDPEPAFQGEHFCRGGGSPPARIGFGCSSASGFLFRNHLTPRTQF